MGKHDISFTPRLMSSSAAAAYIGMSPSKLAGLPIPKKRDGGRVLYDRRDLDDYADHLPYDGQVVREEEAWDERIAGV